MAEPADAPPPDATAPWAVAAGGGTATTPFLSALVRGFEWLSREERAGVATLHVFQGLRADDGDTEALRRAAADAPVQIHRFAPEYRIWLRGAELSVSHAGYNTTTALLHDRVRAVVVPETAVSDQAGRAARLAARGLARVVDGGDAPDPRALADAMAQALDGPRPRHDLDLDGVAATRRLVEELAGDRART